MGSQIGSLPALPAPESLVRHLYLTPHDGLLELGDTLADQAGWAANLSALFEKCTQVQTLSVGARPGGPVLQRLFARRSRIRPQRLSMYNLR